MAIYKIFPEKDATIYSEFSVMNTGIDEILELSTNYPNVSRVLIKFSQDEINNIFSEKIQGSQWQSDLKLYLANIEGLNLSTTLEVYPISGSWDMGTGRFSNIPQTTNGVSWQFRTLENQWPTTFSPSVTASFLPGNEGGGTWYTSSGEFTQSLSYSNDKDLNINVSEIVEDWVSSSIINDGFIIKYSDQDEFVNNPEFNVNIKYFSVDTNTIYPPQLEFKWVDYSFNTGSSSNTILQTDQAVVSLGNNKGQYNQDSIQKFKIYSRPQYPTRVFQTSSLYTTNYYLPTSSYYAIKDLDTNEFVIDFDETYTQISADSESNFFTIYMNGLQPERYYKILIKTIINGSTVILDDKNYFKVING
jgi:hypothetical protein